MDTQDAQTDRHTHRQTENFFYKVDIFTVCALCGYVGRSMINCKIAERKEILQLKNKVINMK